jgi:hypothetical protein
VTGTKIVILARHALLLGLVALFCHHSHGPDGPRRSRPDDFDFRLKHGGERVTLDGTLTRIAHDQAQAMAAKDQLDHDVLGGSRRVSAGGRRPGRREHCVRLRQLSQNPRPVDQFVRAPEKPAAARRHARGVASVKSAKTGRMYWAMVIAGDYESPRAKRQRVHRRNQSRPRSEAKIARGEPAD